MSTQKTYRRGPFVNHLRDAKSPADAITLLMEAVKVMSPSPSTAKKWRRAVDARVAELMARSVATPPVARTGLLGPDGRPIA